MKKTWIIKQSEIPTTIESPEIPSLVLQLLSLRKLLDEQSIRDYLNPDYSKLHDPFLFQDMQRCVERIRKAIEYKEPITIFADYDADAITAAAVMFRVLRKLGALVDCYIPDRFAEGYGMNPEAVKLIAEKGTKVILTVDCGMNAVEEAEICESLGVDLIITDHHELTGLLPKAKAVINPKNPHDVYPFPYLTGVGVAFKVAQALLTRNTYHLPERLKSFSRAGVTRNVTEGPASHTPHEAQLKGVAGGWEKWLLDLVAIGTVADLQSLTGENRILVSFGLKVLPKTKSLGLRTLLDLAGLQNNKYDTFTLGFIIAPRLNAAGRIKHADVAFKLLISEDLAEAKHLAQELTDLNQHRQILTDQILSEAKAQVEMMMDKKVLLAVGTDWPKGVVGLVAGRLMEEYNRPVLAVSQAEGMAVGSARSVANFDMVAALTHAADLLEKYGGHKQAAGFTLRSDNLLSFHSRLLSYAESMNFIFGTPQIEVDAEIKPEDITWENYGYIEQMAPFGIGNPKPKFIGRNIEILDCRAVGGKLQHLKLRLGFGEHRMPGIAFNKGYMAPNLAPGKKIDAIFELSANEWKGNKELELKLVDIHESKN